MTDIEFEDAAIARINAGFISDAIPIKARAFPENPGNYRLDVPHGEVLVHYRSTQYGQPSGLEQALVPTLEVIIVASNRRTPNIGALDIKSSVRRYLTSWMPDGYTQLYPVSDDFLDEADGIWHYGMRFVTGTTYWAGE